MPRISDTKKGKSSRHYLTVSEIEILGSKLKLDKNNLELLLNSKGSIKKKSFFNIVSETINNNEK